MTHWTSGSGVLGAESRYPLPRGADTDGGLVLAGAPLPTVGRLRVYTCGITPYDVTHLGHASVFVWADLLRSVARLADADPLVCRNVTDVDDVLTAAAAGLDEPYDELASTQEFLFERDMRSLRVSDPDLAPHARRHVREVIQLATALLRGGHGYEHDGHVFFRGGDVPGLSWISEEEALALSAEFGDQLDDGRLDRWDVPVWRPSPDDQPAWPSPWGWGRPGWHAECAAMAAHAFGASVDVLVGGADLAFPHHAYQAAMVQAATSVTPFARRTMHVGTVHHAGAKIAKSTGNLVLVRDLLDHAPGAAVRLMLLNRPWAQSWEYDASALAQASVLLEELHDAARQADIDASAPATVTGRLLDDLDVPGAVAVALEAGGAAARRLLDVLKLSVEPSA